MIEEWRDVPGYEGYYQVSNLGSVKSLKRVVVRSDSRSTTVRERILCWGRGTGGYWHVGLSKDGQVWQVMVHTLVAMVFLGERPSGYDICHNDGIKSNNAVSNLRYDTRSANLMDEVFAGRNHHAKKAFCKWGHAFSEGNFRVRNKANGLTQRICKVCSKTRVAFRRDARLNPQEKLVIENLRSERESSTISSGIN